MEIETPLQSEWKNFYNLSAIRGASINERALYEILRERL